MFKNKYALIRAGIVIGFIILTLLLVGFIVYETMPDLIPALKSGKEADIEAFLSRDTSATSLISLFILQVLQVLSIFISGTIVQIAAGAVYGGWKALAVCWPASGLAHFLAFVIYRRLGERMDQLLPESKNGSKLDFIINSVHPGFATALACFFPMLPNGLLPIAASRTTLKPWQYVLIIQICSLPDTIICCCLGEHVISGEWLESAILTGLLFVLVAAMLIFKDKIIRLMDRISDKISK